MIKLSEVGFCGVSEEKLVQYTKLIKRNRRYDDETLRFLKNMIRKESDITLDEKIKVLRDNLEENRMNVYYVDSLDSLIDLLDDLLKPEDIILIDNSFEIFESDLMDRMLSEGINFLPSDPALYYDYKVSRKISLSNRLKRIAEMQEKDLEEYIILMRDFSMISTVGLGSVDLVSAEIGSLIIIDDFGSRGFLCTTPRRNIFLVGLEKILMSFLNAVNTAFALGRTISSKFGVHIHIINNPSRTADIEMVTVYGAHGPREINVILIDNGRSDLIKSEPFKDYLLSIVSQFIEALYPEFIIAANCFELPTIDPLKLMLLLKRMRRGFDRVGTISMFILNKIDDLEDLPLRNSLKAAYARVIDECVERGVDKEVIKIAAENIERIFEEK